MLLVALHPRPLPVPETWRDPGRGLAEWTPPAPVTGARRVAWPAELNRMFPMDTDGGQYSRCYYGDPRRPHVESCVFVSAGQGAPIHVAARWRAVEHRTLRLSDRRPPDAVFSRSRVSLSRRQPGVLQLRRRVRSDGLLPAPHSVAIVSSPACGPPAPPALAGGVAELMRESGIGAGAVSER
jgi:hypothetical protein